MGRGQKGKTKHMENINKKNETKIQTLDLSDVKNTKKAFKQEKKSLSEKIQEGLENGNVLRINLEIGGFIMYLFKVEEKFDLKLALKKHTAENPLIIVDYLFGDKEFGVVSLNLPFEMFAAKTGTIYQAINIIDTKVKAAQTIRN